MREKLKKRILFLFRASSLSSFARKDDDKRFCFGKKKESSKTTKKKMQWKSYELVEATTMNRADTTTANRFASSRDASLSLSSRWGKTVRSSKGAGLRSSFAIAERKWPTL